MNHEEMSALGRVIDHYIHDECNHAQGSGDTSGSHIAHSLMILEKFRERLTSKLIGEGPPAEEVASKPNGEHPYGQAGPIGIVRDNSSHDPDRSIPGQGQQCFVYVLGRADQYADSFIPSYGQISAGCGPNIREDFAKTIWPVVVKVKPHVTNGDLIRHLRDLADAIEEHTQPKDMQRTLGARWLRQPDHTEPTEEERQRGVVASGDLDSAIPF